MDLRDTCDRCGARATQRWVHGKDGRTLTLCSHHSREHHDGLVKAGFLEPITEDSPA